MTDLNIDKAVEAAKRAIEVVWLETSGMGSWDAHADAAIRAALPHIRAALADEIEAATLTTHWAATFENGMVHAASIVRGEES